MTALPTTQRTAPTAATAGREDFASYVAERRPALLRVARAITGDHGTAEDLLHTALASVLPRWGTLREPGAADAYVRRVMINQHRSWCRQPWRRRELSVAEPVEPAGGPPADVPGPGPDLRAVMWRLVAGLPPRQRAAVVLRYYEGLSEAEAARALGCSVGTVKSNTSRGLVSLRQRAGGAGLGVELLAG